MTSSKYLLAILLLSGSLYAQQLSHPLIASRNDAASTPRPLITATDTVNLLAALVQFQIDADSRTSGNGQFDLSTPATIGLDAPPRNRQYFLDHLTFLTNYYRKASKGKVIIRVTLVDSVFTLPSHMQRYSPPKNGPNTAVGDLARDTWRKVDSSGLVPDFSTYDCFVVFHAGVGRDVDLVGTIGFDPTPFDIPSLYLGLNAFREFYGSGYEGIPVRNGFKITNTIIMPETETRELPATPTNFVLTLGINGLLCASVGNFLGLPDLFDTNTGRSGIGRFGLMDGQGIFSFRGAFPPEPSAWEKYWLGWIEPITVSSGSTDLGIPAASVDSARVYRVPISASEYYLIENRNRDAGQNGQRITTRYNAVLRQQTFARDTTGFSAFDISGLNGNVIDVEDLDWSLPGGVNRAGVFFDGGILIWHIDETVIAQGLATNRVNANPNRRGVDVEEADGSQDIGQSYGQLQPGSGSEEGTALDFWYRGNESPIFRNEFSARTYPNTNSNSGANSHITMKDFSPRGARMTAKVIVGSEHIAALPGFPKQTDLQLTSPTLTVASVGSPASVSLLVASTKHASVKPLRSPAVTARLNGEIYAWKTDGTPLLPRELFSLSGGQPLSVGFPYVGASAVDTNSNLVVIADASTNGGSLHVYRGVPSGFDSLAFELLRQPLSRRPTTSPMITDSAIVVGASGGTVYMIWRNGNRIDSLTIPGDTSNVVGIAAVNTRVGFVFSTAAGRIGSNLTFISSSPHNTSNAGQAGAPVIGRVGGKNQLALVTARTDGSIMASAIESGFTPLPGFPVNVGTTISLPPALADLNGDGFRDIIVFAENKIFAYNFAGVSLDYFPKKIPSAKPITSNPVAADVDGDGDVDIVAVSEDGLVVAYDKNGEMAKGFPLQAGIGRQSVAAFAYPDPSSPATLMGLAVASSDDGSVSAWRTGTVGANRQPMLPWPQYQRDAQHTGLATELLSGKPLSSAFFPKERAYNWPNPVYDGRTFLRYFVSENATVTIRIFDLAGDLVAELNGPGIAGVDNEVEWNVRDVQSGIYLARIEANGLGKSETAIVKVAVVK